MQILRFYFMGRGVCKLLIVALWEGLQDDTFDFIANEYKFDLFSLNMLT